MKKLTKLLLDIEKAQYNVNNSQAKDYTKLYIAERDKLLKELFLLLGETDEQMSAAEQIVFMNDVTLSIVQSVRRIGKSEEKMTTSRLEDIFEEVYYKTGETVASGLTTGANFNLVHPIMIQKAINYPIDGKLYSERIWGNKVKLANRVYEMVNEVVKEGTDIRKLSKIMAKEFNTGTYEAMRLLQNETTRVISQAQDEIYKQSEAIDEVMFIATLDNLTTDTCQMLDGKVFKVNDDTKPRIPEDTYINCRSTYIPIVKGWTPTIRRDNLRKENIEFVTFQDWK